MRELVDRKPALPEWPPLIVAGSRPRWMWWRDLLLTVGAWGVFVALVTNEYNFLRSAYRESYGASTHTFESHFPDFLQELQPDAIVVAVLLLFLVGSGAITLRRRRRGFLIPLPAALPRGDEAGRVGMTDEALVAARECRGAVVHVDPDGALRVEQRA